MGCCSDQESIITVTTLSTLRQAQDLELSQSLKSEKFKTSSHLGIRLLSPQKSSKKQGSNIFQFTTINPWESTKEMETPWIFHRVSSMTPWDLPPDPPTESFLPAEWRTRSDQKRIQFQHGQQGKNVVFVTCNEGIIFHQWSFFRIYHLRCFLPLKILKSQNMKYSI